MLTAGYKGVSKIVKIKSMLLLLLLLLLLGTANTILPCDEQESSSGDDEITDKVFNCFDFVSEKFA